MTPEQWYFLMEQMANMGQNVFTPPSQGGSPNQPQGQAPGLPPPPGVASGQSSVSAWQPGQPINFGGSPSNVTSPTGQGPIDSGQPFQQIDPTIEPTPIPQNPYYPPPYGGPGLASPNLGDIPPNQGGNVSPFSTYGWTPPINTPGYGQGPITGSSPVQFDAQGYPIAQGVDGGGPNNLDNSSGFGPGGYSTNISNIGPGDYFDFGSAAWTGGSGPLSNLVRRN